MYVCWPVRGGEANELRACALCCAARRDELRCVSSVNAMCGRCARQRGWAANLLFLRRAVPDLTTSGAQNELQQHFGYTVAIQYAGLSRLGGAAVAPIMTGGRRRSPESRLLSFSLFVAFCHRYKFRLASWWCVVSLQVIETASCTGSNYCGYTCFNYVGAGSPTFTVSSGVHDCANTQRLVPIPNSAGCTFESSRLFRLLRVALLFILLFVLFVFFVS